MTKALEMKRNMKYGVEIEFNSCDNGSWGLVEALKEQGLRVSERSGMHDVTPGWKVVSDGSCGLELVSPVLTSLDQLEKACKALKAVNAKVDRRCGLHVHHDATDLNAEQIKNVYRLYVKHESVIDSMMPESRRLSNNGYCKSVSGAWLNVVESCQTIEDMKRNLGSYQHYDSRRYYKVNFNSYICYGTLEFRQHSGTTDFEKISSWVLLTNLLMEKAKDSKSIKAKTAKMLEKEAEVYYHGITHLFNELHINNTDLSKYIGKRIVNLRKNAVERAA